MVWTRSRIILKLKNDRTMKKGQYTLESWMIANGKSGDSFYSHKKDRHLTAIASHHNRKIITENLIIVSDYLNSPKADKITKVILA